MKRSFRKNSQSGFSLVELLIVCVILIFTIGIISGVLISVQSAHSRHRVRTEAINDATAALDIIARLVRVAGNNPHSISGFRAIQAGSPTGGVYTTIRLRSDWRGSTIDSPPDGDTNDQFENVYFLQENGTLMKQEPGDSNPVEFLANVTALQFRYFDTNNAPIANPNSAEASIARVEITLTVLPPNSPPMTFVTSAFIRQR